MLAAPTGTAPRVPHQGKHHVGFEGLVTTAQSLRSPALSPAPWLSCVCTHTLDRDLHLGDGHRCLQGRRADIRLA